MQKQCFFQSMFAKTVNHYAKDVKNLRVRNRIKKKVYLVLAFIFEICKKIEIYKRNMPDFYVSISCFMFSVELFERHYFYHHCGFKPYPLRR